MQKIIRQLLLPFAAMLVAAVAAVSSCRGDSAAETFTAVVTADTITEGEVLTVTVAVDGPSDGYLMVSEVLELDLSTGATRPTEYVLYDGGTAAGRIDNVSFKDHGRHDFTADELPAGTYRIEVALERGGVRVDAATNVVVLKNQQPDPDPEEPVLVEWFSVPDKNAGLEVDVQGNIILDLVRYNLETPFRFTSVVTPPDATDRRIGVTSKDGSVLFAGMDGDLTMVLSPLKEGVTSVEAVSGDRGVRRTFGVKVVNSQPGPEPPAPAVTDFTLPDVDAQYGRVVVPYGDWQTFTPVVTPDGAEAEFSVSSSDPSVLSVEADGAAIRYKGVAPGYASVSVTAKNGPTKTFFILVYADMTVSVFFEELTATEAQIKTKTFPCKLRFEASPKLAFPAPVVWSVTAKSVVNVTGKDVSGVTDKLDVSLPGDRAAYYDITSRVLLPSYNIYRTVDWTLSLTLSLQRSEALDPDIWRITWNEQWKTQDARIKEYLTDIQQ